MANETNHAPLDEQNDDLVSNNETAVLTPKVVAITCIEPAPVIDADETE